MEMRRRCFSSGDARCVLLLPLRDFFRLSLFLLVIMSGSLAVDGPAEISSSHTVAKSRPVRSILWTCPFSNDDLRLLSMTDFGDKSEDVIL